MKFWVGLIVALGLLGGLSAGCGAEERTRPLQQVVRVPQDEPTIADAVDRVLPGGLVLVGPGTYRESVTIRKNDITVRGTDRNAVVLDGEGKRPNGVVVGSAGVVVENLTTKNYLLNGVLVTGVIDRSGVGIGRGSDGYHHLDTAQYPPVPDFAVRYVTAVDNGLYGIYAFNRQHGTIEHSYASGSADSGFYVGQCEHCDILVTDNVAEYNAVGYESANSTGVSVVRNRFSRNRVGLTMSSDYQEAFAPQRAALVAGNLVSGNDAAQTPEQADGGFGIGIGLGGSVGVRVLRNRIEHNASAGLLVSPAEDLPAEGNTASGNVYAGTGTDLAFWSSAQSDGTRPNCLERPAGATTYPTPWPALVACDRGALDQVPPFRLRPAPPGVPFLDVPGPGPLPTMPGDTASLPYRRAQAPTPVDLETVVVPPATWLARSAR
jgi:hypothetical protein